MGTLTQHVARHVPHTVSSKLPKNAIANSVPVMPVYPADQAQAMMGGSFKASDENGTMGVNSGSPVMSRVNGKPT